MAETKQKTSGRGEPSNRRAVAKEDGEGSQEKVSGEPLGEKGKFEYWETSAHLEKSSSHKSRVQRSKVTGAKVTTLWEKGYSLRRLAWLEDLAPLPPVICLGRCCEAAAV